MSYGPNYFDSYKAAAAYVDKILKRDNPADLPIDQSSRFEFVVNMRTAKTLGQLRCSKEISPNHGHAGAS